MSLSCTCDDYYDVMAVGDLKEVTCRRRKNCTACGKPIETGSKMYFWSMYDYSKCKTARPAMLCEQCGDMTCNLLELGFCINLSESVVEQWFEYLDYVDPNNVALKNREK